MNAGSYENLLSDPSCVVYGNLNQKRKSGDWNQRFCAVWKNYFLCYKDKVDIKPQVAFTLEGFQVEKCNVDDSEQCRFEFKLSKPGVVTHVFQTDSEDKLEQWMFCLNEIIITSNPNDQSTDNEEEKIVLQNDEVPVAIPDEVDSRSASYNFPAVDIEQDKLKNLKVTSSGLHTCLSFDSATQIDEDETLNSNMVRSDEIEDLSHITEDYSSDEELIMIEKDKLKSLQQSPIEDEVFEKSENNLKTGKAIDNSIENQKSETETKYNLQTSDEIEINNQVAEENSQVDKEEDFFSDFKIRSKSLIEEVFEALGMEEEIDNIKETENETEQLLEAVNITNKNNIGDNIEIIEATKRVMPTVGPIKRPEKLYFSTDNTKEHSKISKSKSSEEPVVSIQKMKKSFQELNKGNKKMLDRKEKAMEKSPAPKIKGFVNVISESSPEWRKMWAELKADHIDLRESPVSGKSEQIVQIKGLKLQPSVWDTSRLLAFKLIRNNKVEVIIEPNDVQDFGRWVSGLFHCIQHPRLQQEIAKGSASSFNLPEANTTDWELEMKGDDGIDAVSVKDMRAIFENAKEINSPPASIYSSPSPSLASPVFDFKSQMISTPSDQSPSRHVTPQDFASNYEKMKAKLQSKYADVVCWLGRYIEQEEEKQVLSSMSNPFLAKLRLRHKLEMVSQLEEATGSLEENIQVLKEKLIQKEAAKKEISNKKNSSGLIRSAEDAKRAGNESKRIDKECADIESQIYQSENQLAEMRNAAYELQHEIEMAYEQFDWGQENGHKNEPNSEHDGVTKPCKMEKGIEKPTSKLMLPGWTKNAKGV